GSWEETVCPLLDILDSAFARTNGFNDWPRRWRRRWRCDDGGWCRDLAALRVFDGCRRRTPPQPRHADAVGLGGRHVERVAQHEGDRPVDLRERNALRLCSGA